MNHRDPARGEPDLDHLLLELARDDARITAPAALRGAVLAEWDARSQAPRPSPAPRSRPWLTRLAAVAAAAVFVVGWLVTRSVHDSLLREVPRRAADGPAAAPAALTNTALTNTALTGLMAEAPVETETLQIVRVRMPREALRAFGVALVDPEAPSGVEVDVLVGDDGVPRSIRQVRPVPAGDQERDQ